jgi:hypothetical protein
LSHRFRTSHILAALVAAITVSCGPPLTDPGNGDVSGTWFSPGPAAGLTNVSINLTQTQDGTISGTYTATGTPSLQVCPATGSCAITGTVTGANTVFQVFFDLKDAGQFTGQLITATELKGAMNRSSSTEPIAFTR